MLERHDVLIPQIGICLTKAENELNSKGFFPLF